MPERTIKPLHEVLFPSLFSAERPQRFRLQLVGLSAADVIIDITSQVCIPRGSTSAQTDGSSPRDEYHAASGSPSKPLLFHPSMSPFLKSLDIAEAEAIVLWRRLMTLMYRMCVTLIDEVQMYV